MSLSEHEAEFLPKRGGEFQPRPTGAVSAESETAPEPEPEPVVTGDETADDTARVDMDRQRAEAINPNLRYEDKPKLERHRAKSQEAKPEDVATIRTLTATLKERTDAWQKLKKSEGDSPRVLALRQRIRGMEADIAEASRPAVVEPPRREAPPARVAEPTSFTESEPSYKTFEADPAKYPDPYLAYTRAVAAYDRRKDNFETQQTRVKQDAETQRAAQTRQAQEAEQRDQVAHGARMKTFVATHPDLPQKLQELQAKGHDVPPVVTKAIMQSDNGPELLYALTRRPDVLDQLLVTNWQTPVTEATVVAMRRYLTTLIDREAAGTTGAAPAQRPDARVPRPPTPVKTGPLKTGTEPPGDGASLADHESAYSRRRR